MHQALCHFVVCRPLRQSNARCPCAAPDHLLLRRQAQHDIHAVGQHILSPEQLKAAMVSLYQRHALGEEPVATSSKGPAGPAGAGAAGGGDATARCVHLLPACSLSGIWDCCVLTCVHVLSSETRWPCQILHAGGRCYTLLYKPCAGTQFCSPRPFSHTSLHPRTTRPATRPTALQLTAGSRRYWSTPWMRCARK